MYTSEAITELAAALAKAQGEFPPIERGRTATVKTKGGGSYKYNYADLADVLSAVEPVLSKYGLSISHNCVVTREPLGVETTFTLTHASGQYKESDPLWLPCDDFMAPIQAIGSACTYGKRYTAQNGLGIATETDDDGNAAAGHDAETSHKENNLPPCPKCQTNKSVIVGKPEYGGGYLCFQKKGGCGAKWQDLPAEEPPGPPEPQPKGTRTAKADAKAKADKLAEEHGMKTADQLAELTDAERAYVNDATQQIAEAKSIEILETIKAFLGDKPEHVKAKLRGLWAAKKKEIEGRTAA